MSRANKCDRCGTLYEYDYKNCGNGTYFIGRRPYNNEFLDLCPTCQKELFEWFIDGKRKETE